MSSPSTSQARRRRPRRIRSATWLLHLASDVRSGLRQARRRPATAWVAILTLGLGIGASVSIFSLVESLLLRPLPLERPDEIVVLRVRATGPESAGEAAWSEVVSPLELGRWQQMSTGPGGIELAGYTHRGVTESSRLPAVRLSAMSAGDGFFGVLGARAAAGRLLASQDYDADAEDVAVLSFSYWRSAYGGSDVVGRELIVDGRRHEIVGVAGAEVERVFENRDLWVPLRLSVADLEQEASYLGVLGRFEAPSTIESASAVVGAAQRRLMETRSPSERREVRLLSLRDELLGDQARRLWLLFGGVLLVLLIGCVNVSHLLISQVRQRSGELTVRRSLGAGPGRLTVQLVVETGVLCLLGGLLGVILWLALASILTSVLVGSVIESTVAGSASLRSVLAFAGLLVVSTTLLSGVLPAIGASRSLASDLKRRHTRRDALGSSFVAVQVALTLCLLAGAGLLVQSLLAEMRVERGFETSERLTAQFALPRTDYPSHDSVLGTLDRVLDAARSLPGVDQVALTNRAPLIGSSVGVEWSSGDAASPRLAGLRMVSPDYFRAAGITVLAGRELSRGDHTEAANVVVVNSAMARLLWGDVAEHAEDDPYALSAGRKIETDNWAFTGGEGDWEADVVGVVEDTLDFGLRLEPRPLVYVSYRQAPAGPWEWIDRTATLIISTEGDSLALAEPLRRVLAEIDPRLPLAELGTLDGRLRDSQSASRAISQLFAALGLLALVLALSGVYSTAAFGVAQRESEVGVRMALGARRDQVVASQVTRSLGPVALGSLAGLLAGAFVSSRLLNHLLFGVGSLDVATFATACAMVVAGAGLVSWLAARRLADVDPARVLDA